jgi:hypothetical protein
VSKKIEVQKTEVVSIKLRIKGKEIDLTLEDAKELRDALNKVFAEPVTIKEYVPYYPYIPYEPYKPYEPYIQPYWGDGTGQTFPGLYCSPNTTSGTLTVGDMPATSYTAYKTLIDQVCNTYPTTETCGSRNCEVITIGGSNVIS